MRLLTIGLLTALGIMVGGLLFLQTPLLGSVRSWTWDAWVYGVARMARIEGFQVTDNVYTQLQELRAENIRLQAEQADYQQLREQLAVPSFASYTPIPAAVTSRTIDTFGTEVVVNRGVRDGVALRAPVVAYGSVLVGFITQVHEHSAVVTFLYNSGTEFPAQVLTEQTPQGLLVGRNHAAVFLTTIPRDAEIPNDTSVVTRGNELLPEGLLIGTVSQVVKEDNAVYQEARIALPYQPTDIEAVSILTP